VTRLARLLGRARDRRFDAAQAAYEMGDFGRARELGAEIVAEGGALLDVVRGLAEVEYLLGDYAASEALLRQVVASSGRDASLRVDAEAALALVYLQTNRFAESRRLFAGLEDEIELPIWELMRSFGDEPPYRMDWMGREEAVIPFLQEADSELPRLALEIDGRALEARIDTGGDLLVLTQGLAAALRVEPVVSAQGVFAAGAQGSIAYGRVGTVNLGGIAVEGVPVSIVDLDLPMVGTGFLRQFLATVDYPARRLVLRPPGSPAPEGAQVPFALAATHLLIARGSLNDVEPLTFVLDSGLQHEDGSALTAPASTLAAAGIAVPETRKEERESGAGHIELELGPFPVARLGLGRLVQRDLTGLYGAFAPEWAHGLGFAVHGLVSHGFLRRHAWTLDFQRMTMTFALPD
jgi:tetratricopeptide (TPR) repeat protein